MYFLTAIFTVITFLSTTNLSNSETTPSNVPVVLWHGMGDSCCFSFSLGYIKKLLEKQLPNVYVKSIRIGNNVIEDVENSYFGDINKQIETVCDELSRDPNLKNGYNAVGFSQGGQFLRAIAQRCPNPRMINLISLGGQHQGVYGIPNCLMLHEPMCNIMRKLLSFAAYTNVLQDHIIQAGFWHDPLKEDDYKKKNRFLADINNELNINRTYIKNLRALKKLVLIKFMNDHMVYPVESEWFGFYQPGRTDKILSLNQTALYKKDRLGLRKMMKYGQVEFIELPGDHLQFTEEWFIESIVNKYLKQCVMKSMCP